ncbi:hypothetical protein F4861DRAFT_409311 [Xylaria intraflava]|nr:hypothetical protein F4861DRAFT_409311 [Xylaria intraflava]
MFRAIFALGAASFASAVGLLLHDYPPYSLSTGFRLVANVTDPETDLLGIAPNGSIGSWELQGIHIGAGFNEAVLTNSSGGVFYHNATDLDLRSARGSILTDGGIPPFPMGIYLQPKDKNDSGHTYEYGVGINAGPGTIGVSLNPYREPYSYLTAHVLGTFVACLRTVAYYSAQFIVVRYAYAAWDPTTKSYLPTIPEACTPINFIPECAVLPNLPEGSLASHEFARKSRCYENVSAIEWSKYASVPALLL